MLRVDQAKPRGKEAAPRRKAPLACPKIQCGLRAAKHVPSAIRPGLIKLYMPLSRPVKHEQTQLSSSRADCILVQDTTEPDLLTHAFDEAPPLSAAAQCRGSTEMSEPPWSSEYPRV